MSDYSTCRETMGRYLKARIPLITVRTGERARALEFIREQAEKCAITIYRHTISQGTRDILTERQVNDDRSVMGAVAFAADQMSQRQGLTFVLTEVTGIEDDTPDARHFFDVVMLAVERGGCLVVITEKPVWSTLQRLGMAITLDTPNEDEMLAIIREQISPYRTQMPIEWNSEDEKSAAAILTGLTRIEAENVIATLLVNRTIRKSDLGELTHAKDRIFADISGIEKIFIRGQALSIGGLDGLKRWLLHERPLLTADLRECGIRPPRGVLLVGVPGCGKSLSAKAIASTWNMPLYRLDLATIYGQYVGQSEGRLKEALATADHVAPCVLWIDEIEKGLAGAGSGNDGGVSTRLVGQFLFWLQESHARVFVVATANDVSRLPPELLRRGRFDELFFVDLPNPAERKEIINIYTKRGIKSQFKDELLDELVERSDGFAGADIESAVREITKESYFNGTTNITDDFVRRCFENVVPLSKTNPEAVEAIRAWGRDRAVPASGIIQTQNTQVKYRRAVIAN